MALNTSEVVAARAIEGNCIPIWEYVKKKKKHRGQDRHGGRHPLNSPSTKWKVCLTNGKHPLQLAVMRKPNTPQEVMIGSGEFSLRTDGKVNVWLLVAMVAGAANDVLFHSNYLPGFFQEGYQRWPVACRALIELIPVFAALLWVRSLLRWVQGMDELHRRTTIQAWLFATGATILFLSIWPLLESAGIAALVLRETQTIHLEALSKPNFPVTMGMIWIFHLAGQAVINRYYK